MNETAKSVRAKDGRALDVIVSGPDGGLPLLFHHGTPGSKIQFEPWAEMASARGLRFVTYSRPGYGVSDRQEHRTVADCAADAEAILDDISADGCVTMGGSGGGPHALACAALLPERVRGCATLAGVGPYDVEGLDFMAGMGQDNIDEFGMALDDHAGLVSFMEGYRDATADATVEGIVEALKGLLSPVDAEAMTGEFGGFFVDSDREAFRSGIWGWLDDDIAFTKPWGFDLRDIRVPVTVWQGAQDLMVPFAHGEWLAAHIPTAKPELRPEHGHISLALGGFDEILLELITSAG